VYKSTADLIGFVMGIPYDVLPTSMVYDPNPVQISGSSLEISR